jgi:hypothetical protein
MFSVKWSEHFSYKNTRRELRKFTTTGPALLVKPVEENAGEVDAGCLGGGAGREEGGNGGWELCGWGMEEVGRGRASEQRRGFVWVARKPLVYALCSVRSSILSISDPCPLSVVVLPKLVASGTWPT